MTFEVEKIFYGETSEWKSSRHDELMKRANNAKPCQKPHFLINEIASSYYNYNFSSTRSSYSAEKLPCCEWSGLHMHVAAIDRQGPPRAPPLSPVLNIYAGVESLKNVASYWTRAIDE